MPVEYCRNYGADVEHLSMVLVSRPINWNDRSTTCWTITVTGPGTGWEEENPIFYQAQPSSASALALNAECKYSWKYYPTGNHWRRISNGNGRLL